VELVTALTISRCIEEKHWTNQPFSGWQGIASARNKDAASGQRQELTSPGPIGNRLSMRFPATKSFRQVGSSAAMAAKFLKTGTNCWLLTKLCNHVQRF